MSKDSLTRAPDKLFLGGAVIKTNPDVVVVVLSYNLIYRFLLVSVINVG